MKRVFFLFGVLSALSLAAPTPAFADEAAARVHFKKGIELYDKKAFQEALGEFEAAYKEKPSAGIKQNVALCLKGLNRAAEAATAFDEALDEGKESLKPETKAAIEQELAELSKVVATVHITIAGSDDKRSADTVVSIQPAAQAQARALPPGAQRKPIRLMPGVYILGAKVPGAPANESKRLALVAGAPTEVTFGEPPAQSTLVVHSNVPEAVIRVDGVEVGKGSWTGPVPANKKMRVEVDAPNYRPLGFDMTVPANSTVDSPVTLQPIGSTPGEYRGGVANGAAAPKPRGRVYLVPYLSLDAAPYRLSQAVGAGARGGLRTTYGGASIGGRLGFLATKGFALEATAEVGGMGTDLDAAATGGTKYESTLVHWMLLPGIRFQTAGKVRFAMGTGVGLYGLVLTNKPGSGASSTLGGDTNSIHANGFGFAWMGDLGVQFDVGPLWMEIAAYANVHGVGPVKESDTDERALLSSPGVRGGARVGLGIPF